MRPATPPHSVLVVEDNPVLAEAIKFALGTFGWTVVGPFATNDAAMAAVSAETFGTALLDLDLGGTLSTPTAQLLRERGVPFLFMTGHDASTAIPEGFHDQNCLVKPVEPEQLIEALEALISGS
ncbi:MAG: response regulator [Planctomycetota bacterium]|nr:response regulator [Planctomycetota bacterium]MDG1984452.1 response regulator [Planctomycetota bacterium]